MNKKKISRRKFLKAGVFLIIAFFIYLWTISVKRAKTLYNRNKEVVIDGDIADGITIMGPVIINKSKWGTSVFSSRCTHLGCTIKQQKEGKLICPCHGSEYNLMGQPVKGPAIKPLEQLGFIRENNKLRIKLS